MLADAGLVFLAAGLTLGSMVCPDGKVCPDKSTCCEAGDEYECCGYPNAVCCPDHMHCCPQGFHCNMERQVCERRVQSSVIRCDGFFYCPLGHTCCKSPEGRWGCCPYPLAQCCQDGVHCCEYGYRCDRTSLQCTRGYMTVPATRQEAQRG